NASNPDLYFDVLSNDIAPGTTVEIAIVVGRDTSTAIYGIGFEIDIDRNLVSSNSLNLEFTNGIMTKDTSYVSIVVGRDTSTGKMIAAITRTDSVNIFDFGTLAKLTFTIDSNATPGEELGLQITNSGGTVINGDTTDYFHPPGKADTNLTIGEPKGLPETFNYSSFKLYPNPTDRSVSFDIPNDMLGPRYEFLNNIGQVVLSGNLTTKNLDVSQLHQGLYHVRVYSSKRVYYQELEILR
ncbi:MAG: T9SS type A sorting domain-containing protein, partial [Bacteroidia bacterium]|nr:T9SS type A sorting domain-containing protein [Bacteroidia bacterium]